jgi:hypothetical protein
MDLGHGDKWRLDTCPACPAQALPAGLFDVLDRPGSASRYDPTAGYRINMTTGLPECIHPSRVRLPPCRYASNHEPLPTPTQPRPPDDVADLETWFIAVIRAAPAESRATVATSPEPRPPDQPDDGSARHTIDAESTSCGTTCPAPTEAGQVATVSAGSRSQLHSHAAGCESRAGPAGTPGGAKDVELLMLRHEVIVLPGDPPPPAATRRPSGAGGLGRARRPRSARAAAWPARAATAAAGGAEAEARRELILTFEVELARGVTSCCSTCSTGTPA